MRGSNNSWEPTEARSALSVLFETATVRASVAPLRRLGEEL